MTSTMRPFGMISTSIWQSERFCSLCSLDTRLAYLWLHTSAKTCAGALRIGPAHLSEEVDFVGTLERANEIFGELESAGLISWNRPYVVIAKYLSFNPVKTHRHAIGAFREALALPECDAKDQLMREIKRQEGAMELAKWRNKSGDPHDLLFAVHQYFDGAEATPPEPHSDPIGNPSGKIKNGIDKRERRTPAEPESPVPEPPRQLDRQEMLRSEADGTPARKPGPRAETLQSDLVKSAHSGFTNS